MFAGWVNEFIPPGIAASEAGVLVVVAFFTSTLSAIVGMAGGITLLAVMLLFLEPLVAIPLHAVVQVVSNSSRAAVHRRAIEWRILVPFLLPLLPLGWLSLDLAEQLSPSRARTIIGAFVLVATWAPGLVLLGRHPEHGEPRRRFFLLGCLVGVVNVTVGASGPLIAPFFLNLGISRFALIGTKAACQTGAHLAKIVVFGLAGFAYAAWAPLLMALSLTVVLGTLFGSRLLGRLNERGFVILYRSALTLIALRLVVAG